MVAALFVERDGAYYDLPNVETWGGYSHNDRTEIDRDARDYRGPHPVVAHPPCERWGRFATGSTAKPNQYNVGEDGGCFAVALTAVRTYGGVLEHPKDSEAWDYYGLQKPAPEGGGWYKSDAYGGWTCCVDQGRYGHFANKPTWLYAAHVDLPSLIWAKGAQRIHPRAYELHGYKKARRIGQLAMVGGKDKKRIRNTTPEEFRDLLLSIARLAGIQRALAKEDHNG